MDNKRAVVIGGGFYGCAIAVHLAERGWRATVFERGGELMTRASFVNQARLHNGYHYPRSFLTAIRSRANLPAFRDVYAEAVYDDFAALYAVARNDSKVSARHFERFCRAAGMPLKPASKADAALFDPRFVEAVWRVDEPAFDADRLRRRLEQALARPEIDIRMNAPVRNVEPGKAGELIVRAEPGNEASAQLVFNCTYAALNHVGGARAALPLKHQVAEIALIEPPRSLANRGVTIMDGPFFSVMPFPARGAHSLTHVRYTHHFAWEEKADEPSERSNPLDALAAYLDVKGGAKARSRFPYMIRDARRFVPALADAVFADALFDIKTLLTQTAFDDARPILFQRDAAMPNLISILGGKIDNIFDIFDVLDDELNVRSRAPVRGFRAEEGRAP